MRGLFESRVMTLAHAAALHFGGSLEAAKKRTQRLKHARYIGERPRARAYDPSILFLARRGFEALRSRGNLTGYPVLGWESMQRRAHVSPHTLRHELDVLSTKAAMVSALRTRPHHRILQFSTWPRLFAFKARQETPDGFGRSVVMSPDGFARIAIDGDRPSNVFFFMELDRSTEAQQRLGQRAGGYLEFYRSGGFASRYGRPANAFREFPFRVLWIFRNAERRNNAAETFLRHHPPLLTMPWLTTFDELLNDPLGRVWIRPIDYLNAIRGSSFDSMMQSPARHYRRQNARETFVESRVAKLALLAKTQKSDP